MTGRDEAIRKVRKGKGLSWRNEFGQGAAETVVARLREQREQTAREVRAESAGNSSALAVVERGIAKLGQRAVDANDYGRRKIGLRPIRSAYRHDENAREQGRQAGRSVALGGNARGAIGGRAREIGQ